MSACAKRLIDCMRERLHLRTRESAFASEESMSGPTELLRHARARAETLRRRYRSAGFWSAAPLDVIRSAAAAHPDLLALQDRKTALTYAQLDERVDRVGWRAAGRRGDGVDSAGAGRGQRRRLHRRRARRDSHRCGGSAGAAERWPIAGRRHRRAHGCRIRRRARLERSRRGGAALDRRRRTV